MTEKQFLNMINNVDERLLQETYEVFDPQNEAFGVNQANLTELQSTGKKRILIRPLLYTAALLAVVVSLSVFSRYYREIESGVQGTNDIQTESDVPKTDYVITESELIYGNITLNSKISSPLGGMICPSEQGLYFSNPNDGGRIYCIKNYESELAVNMPARFINYYGGKLYFISPDYNYTIYDNVFLGKPYSYDVKTGELKELTNSEAVTSLTVTDEGIYYNKIGNNSSSLDTPELWLMDLDGENPRQCGYAYALRSGDNVIDAEGVHALTDDKLNIASDFSIKIEAAHNSLKGACVYDNKLITYSGGVINITDLNDGSVKSIDINSYNNFIDNKIYESEISDYTILNNQLYIAFSGSSLMKINLLESDGSIQKLFTSNSDMVYTKLYTDGTFLYALGSNYKDNSSCIARLSIGANQITAKELM